MFAHLKPVAADLTGRRRGLKTALAVRRRTTDESL
jgi:hypothetical protein